MHDLRAALALGAKSPRRKAAAAQAATGVAAAIKRYSPCEWEKAPLPYLAGCRCLPVHCELPAAGVLYTIVSWIRGSIVDR